MAEHKEHVLVITIVQRGWGEKVVESACKAGAEGATVAFGRGMGVHEHQKILGIAIEPEKELVLTVVPREKADKVIDTISAEAELDKPGRGLAFILPIEKVVGIAHSQHLRKKCP